MPISKPIDPIVPAFREWALLRMEVNSLTAKMNKLRDTVAAAVESRGYRDHRGHQYIDLPFPITVGDTEFTRIKRERRASVMANEEIAERIAREKDVYDRLFPPVRSLDTEELYVLYQEGVLTQSEMDEILETRETYAFKGVS